jgi:predicted nuclease of predicted toxin-antitoxin system
MRLLLDMNLSPRWVELLSKAGFDAVHLSTIGPGNASDEQIMSFARAHGYVVVTHDLDYGAILAATQGTTPSVVQVRSEHLGPEIIGQSVINALRETTSELETGALVTIDVSRTRVRILPLTSKE